MKWFAFNDRHSTIVDIAKISEFYLPSSGYDDEIPARPCIRMDFGGDEDTFAEYDTLEARNADHERLSDFLVNLANPTVNVSHHHG